VQVQQRLDQLEQRYRRFTEDSWRPMVGRADALLGYRYDTSAWSPDDIADDAQQAMASNSTITQDTGDAPRQQPKGPRADSTSRSVAWRDDAELPRGSPSARTLALLEQAADRLGPPGRTSACWRTR